MNACSTRDQGRNPDIDLIVAVHSDQRPVERAVASALSDVRAATRVTVVCHNIAPERIVSRLGALSADARVRVVAHDDGLRSPAGPFNAGLDLATAHYTSIMGSDDSLEPGALDSWLRLAHSDGTPADVVIAGLSHAGGRRVPTPPVRPFRRTRLDMVRDRLSYRTAPLGLVSRDTFGSLRLTEGLRTGEDIQYGLTLWARADRIVFARSEPGYLVHADAVERVTTAFGLIEHDLGFMGELFSSEVFRALAPIQRSAFLTKLVRGSLFTLVTNRMSPHHWTDAELNELGSAARRFLTVADGRSTSPAAAFPSLSQAEVRLFEEMLADSTGVAAAEALIAAAAATRRRFSPGTLLTPRIRDILRPDAPLRFSAASAALLLHN